MLNLTKRLLRATFLSTPASDVKVTRPSFFGGVPSYFEALWYPHLEWITYRSIYNIT